MKTDSLFYELFRHWPAVALDLAGLDPAAAARYEFRAEELKQTAFRLDGLLVPSEASADPIVFIEVQYQPDDSLYPRLFAELFLYLRRAPKPRDWRVLVLYPVLGVERIPIGYANLIALPEVHRVDLGALGLQERSTPGWDLLRLIVDDADTAVARAARLIHGGPTPLEPAVLNFIETVLVYQLPRRTREEIQTMLGLTDIDLKQTRFYQDVHAEGRLEGKLEGRRAEAAALLLRLARVRFGEIPTPLHTTIAEAGLEQLEDWLERLVTAPDLASVFSGGAH